MTEKNMWNLSPQEALKACQASEQGLTTEQAEKIRLEKGENVLLEEKKKSAFQVFLDQFKDLMVVILIGAAIISMFSGNEESTIVIFAVLVMNAVLGTVQHMKAEKSLESLKQLSAPDAKVIQPGAGGADGFGLHVKGQHPSGGGGQIAQKGGVPAVAAGGV